MSDEVLVMAARMANKRADVARARVAELEAEAARKDERIAALEAQTEADKHTIWEIGESNEMYADDERKLKERIARFEAFAVAHEAWDDPDNRYSELDEIRRLRYEAMKP